MIVVRRIRIADDDADHDELLRVRAGFPEGQDDARPQWVKLLPDVIPLPRDSFWVGWTGIAAQPSPGGGYVVEIDHGNGMVTVYNHLGSIWVTAGQAVFAGQGIAGVGCTGLCTGPHVHFVVMVNGRIDNPQRYF